MHQREVILGTCLPVFVCRSGHVKVVEGLANQCVSASDVASVCSTEESRNKIDESMLVEAAGPDRFNHLC